MVVWPIPFGICGYHLPMTLAVLFNEASCVRPTGISSRYVSISLARVTLRLAARNPADEPLAIESSISRANLSACAFVRNVLLRVIPRRRINARHLPEGS
jgi:hypothetical protein